MEILKREGEDEVVGAVAVGAMAIGAEAIGAVAVGAVAVGAGTGIAGVDEGTVNLPAVFIGKSFRGAAHSQMHGRQLQESVLFSSRHGQPYKCVKLPEECLAQGQPQEFNGPMARRRTTEELKREFIKYVVSEVRPWEAGTKLRSVPESTIGTFEAISEAGTRGGIQK